MHIVQQTTDRLVLETVPPLFRPFFFGGLGVLAVGVGLLIGGPLLRGPSGGETASAAGPGIFLAAFGFFVTIVPAIGKIPYRRQIIVDRAEGAFIRRDRTLLRLRQESYPLGAIRAVDVEEARHVDGDPYFALVLRLESGESASIERFNDRDGAARVARLVRDHLDPSSHHAPGPQEVVARR